jgi:hypothetical protein
MIRYTVFIFLGFLLSACGGGADVDTNQKPPSKTEHFYFENFVVRSFSDQFTNITIKIPECFEKDDYGSYSVNNNWMLKCYDNYSFLTIDYFSKEDIENYFYYYAEDNEEIGDHIDYLLNFVVKRRASNLIEPEISQRTSEKNDRNAHFVFQSVVGRETNYKDNLFFMFGAVELNGQYFIVQTICAHKSLKFHLADFKKMILSIKRV